MTSLQEILKAINSNCLYGQAITQQGFVHLKYKLVKCPWNYKPVFLIQLGNIQHYFQHPALWMAQWSFRLQHTPWPPAVPSPQSDPALPRTRGTHSSCHPCSGATPQHILSSAAAQAELKVCLHLEKTTEKSWSEPNCSWGKQGHEQNLPLDSLETSCFPN